MIVFMIDQDLKYYLAVNTVGVLEFSNNMLCTESFKVSEIFRKA